jgi:hypothetical protein
MWMGVGVRKPTRQPRGIIPIRRNQSQHFETLALNWVITKVEIPNSAAPSVLFCSPNLGLLLNGLVPPVFRLLSCTAIPYTLYNTAIKDQAILYVCVCGIHSIVAWRCNSVEYFFHFSPRTEDIRPGQQGRTCTKGNSHAREPYIPTSRAR